MIKLNTRIGRFPVQIDFQDMKHLHKFGAVYGNLPQKCDACGSDNIFLSFKNPGGNDYYTLQCGDCTADANFGQHKKDSSLYWKREKMAVYVQNGENQPATDQEVKDELDDFDPPEPKDETEVPF